MTHLPFARPARSHRTCDRLLLRPRISTIVRSLIACGSLRRSSRVATCLLLRVPTVPGSSLGITPAAR